MKKKKTPLILSIMLIFCMIGAREVSCYSVSADDAENDVVSNFSFTNFTLSQQTFNYLINNSNITYPCADLVEVSTINQPGISDQYIVVNLNANLTDCNNSFELFIYFYDEFENVEFNTQPVLYIYVSGILAEDNIRYSIFNYSIMNWSYQDLSGSIIGHQTFKIDLKNELDRSDYYGLLAFMIVDNYVDIAYSDNLFKTDSESEYDFSLGDLDISIDIDFFDLIIDTIIQNLPLIIIYTVNIVLLFTILALRNKKNRRSKRK